MRVHVCAPVFGAIVALLVAARPGTAQRSGTDDQMEQPEVRSLDLSGVRSVNEDELLRSIATSASRCKSIALALFCPLSHSDRLWEKRYLDRTELRRDVLRIRVFYWKRGFRSATVDTSVTPRGDQQVAVTFQITEGPPTITEVVRVEQTDSVLSPAQIDKLVRPEAGEPFDLVALDSSLASLRAVLADYGYAAARVDTATAVDTAAHQARATITVRPRFKVYVGDIRIEGNQSVSQRTIRHSLSFRPGDLFKRSELNATQRRLYESGLFQRASISSPRAGSDSVRTVVVTVAEAEPRLTRLSGGFNTFDFIQVDARFTHNNFLGGARRLLAVATLGNLFAKSLNGSQIGGLIGFQDLTGDIGGAKAYLRPTYQASLDFTQPWVASPRNSAGVSIFAYRRLAPGVFIERGEGGNVSFTREVAEGVPVSLAYRFELTGIDAGDVYFCVNYGVCDPQTIAALRARQRLAPLSLTANFNRANDPLEPTRGYTAQVRLDHASAFTASSFRYNSVYLEGAAYRPVGRRMVLAAHSRVGFVRPLASTKVATRAGEDVSGAILHPRTRLYAGGARSVRGVGENQLGPRVLTIAPDKLDDICPFTGEAVAQCDLSGLDTAGNALQDRDFTPRPLGGRALIEGSVELRFPIWRALRGAAFVDGALLGQGSLQNATQGAGAVTPGVGIRYRSAVGPIRIDLGLNPTLPANLPVITEIRGPNGERRIIQLDDRWRYNPTGGASGITGVLRRLTLHLSIGEAY